VALAGAITTSSVVARDAEAVSCELGGGAALLDLRSGTYFSMNPVGAFVWGLLNDPVEVSTLHNVLHARYDVEPDACLEDLLSLLQQLADAGLIRVANAGAS
jgi:Coenzyme PQQ synthesis protein D (PqqD)